MKENKSTTGGLVLRGITLSYIALLIVLPVIAISCKAFDGGIARLWQEITLPQALFSLKITLILALIIAIVNVITGTATAWVLVRCDFPFKREINAIIDLPFAIPTIVTGIMLVALYGPRSFIGAFMQNTFNHGDHLQQPRHFDRSAVRDIPLRGALRAARAAGNGEGNRRGCHDARRLAFADFQEGHHADTVSVNRHRRGPFLQPCPWRVRFGGHCGGQYSV